MKRLFIFIDIAKVKTYKIKANLQIIVKLAFILEILPILL